MSKQFALFDFDKTLYDGFSLLNILNAQVKAGQVAADMPKRVQQSLDNHAAGKISYEDMAQEQLKMYAESLKGQRYEDAFQTCLEYFRQTEKIFHFVEPVIDLLSNTHQIALVTALPEHGAKAAAAVVGVTEIYCSTYGVKDGVFDGTVTLSLGARGGKKSCVERIQQEHSMDGSFVFGDSEGDIEMLAAATYPICVRPSDGLRREAEQNGWHICQPDEVLPTVRRLVTQ
jgi:HAD superfamily phosphoserine phosphatase-like hydrolase